MSRRRDVDLGLSMQLSLPRRFDSTLSPSMIVPRCGSTLQLIVADLCGRRRYHTFSASATLKSFQHALALSLCIEASRLIAVHRGAIIEGDASQTLVSLGLTDGSIVHAFAREATATVHTRPSRHSAAEPSRRVHSAWQLSSGVSGMAPGLEVPVHAEGREEAVERELHVYRIHTPSPHGATSHDTNNTNNYKTTPPGPPICPPAPC